MIKKRPFRLFYYDGIWILADIAIDSLILWPTRAAGVYSKKGYELRIMNERTRSARHNIQELTGW